MNKPYLTIGIPTYNRKEQIQRCVRSILPQLNESVCLVVRDNASNYSPASLFTQEELNLFVLQINPHNIGGDANILSLLASCTTPWCWVIGDDDPLMMDSLSRVLKEIEANPDAAYINFCSRFDTVLICLDIGEYSIIHILLLLVFLIWTNYETRFTTTIDISHQ